MTRKSSELTHHEELRLDYLQKNIHYLNNKEKQEIAYLLYKKDLQARYGQPKSSKQSASSYHEPVLPAYEAAYEEDYQDDFEEGYEDEDLLPAYPDSSHSNFQLEEEQEGSTDHRHVRTRTQGVPLRKSKKRKKGRIKRFFTLLLCFFILMFIGLGFSFVKGFNSVTQRPVAEVFNGVDTDNGINILILGTDGRIGENSGETRTDTIMVLNVNNKENKVKLVSFMRDTLVDIEGYEYKLNTAYTLGEQDNRQGAEEVRKTLKNNFDIDISYYAMVDFATFATTIDTLFPEGVTIDAQFSTINGETVSSVEVPNDLQLEENAPAYQTIQVGLQQMDGKTLLNYARYRSDDEGDFGRTRRQQQVLSTVITQAKNPLKLFSGSEAIGKVVAMTPTTVPQSFMWLQGPGVVLDAANGIERLTIPENGDWIDDYDMYGGMALRIDFEKYQQRLAELGLR